MLAGEEGDGGAVFIVRVGGDVHGADGGFGRELGAVEAGGAAVFGDGILGVEEEGEKEQKLPHSF